MSKNITRESISVKLNNSLNDLPLSGGETISAYIRLYTPEQRIFVVDEHLVEEMGSRLFNISEEDKKESIAILVEGMHLFLSKRVMIPMPGILSNFFMSADDKEKLRILQTNFKDLAVSFGTKEDQLNRAFEQILNTAIEFSKEDLKRNKGCRGTVGSYCCIGIRLQLGKDKIKIVVSVNMAAYLFVKEDMTMIDSDKIINPNNPNNKFSFEMTL